MGKEKNDNLSNRKRDDPNMSTRYGAKRTVDLISPTPSNMKREIKESGTLFVLKKEWEKIINNLHFKIQLLEKQQFEIQHMLSELKRESESLKLLHLEKDQSEILNRIEELSNEINQLQTQHDSINKEISALRSDIGKFVEYISKLSQAKARITTRLEVRIVDQLNARILNPEEFYSDELSSSDIAVRALAEKKVQFIQSSQSELLEITTNLSIDEIEAELLAEAQELGLSSDEIKQAVTLEKILARIETNTKDSVQELYLEKNTSGMVQESDIQEARQFANEFVGSLVTSSLTHAESAEYSEIFSEEQEVRQKLSTVESRLVQLTEDRAAVREQIHEKTQEKSSLVRLLGPDSTPPENSL
jgi:prefoldin subunit 5